MTQDVAGPPASCCDREAELFGDLNASPTAAERQALAQLLQACRKKMTRYLGQVGLPAAEIDSTLAGLKDQAGATRLAGRNRHGIAASRDPLWSID